MSDPGFQINRAVSRAAVLFVVALFAAGCAQPSTSTPAPAAAPPTQVLGATPPPAPTSSGQPTSSGERISGTVQAVTGGTITLAGGKSLALGPNTQIIRVQPATSADLQPQEYVAITAARQPDGTLLASMVNIFAESQRGLGAGQRPMAGGNLMTNATITGISGDTFTASFPGGEDKVKLAPGVRITKIVSATPQDITAGKTISALVANGVARSVSIQ